MSDAHFQQIEGDILCGHGGLFGGVTLDRQSRNLLARTEIDALGQAFDDDRDAHWVSHSSLYRYTVELTALFRSRASIAPALKGCQSARVHQARSRTLHTTRRTYHK